MSPPPERIATMKRLRQLADQRGSLMSTRSTRPRRSCGWTADRRHACSSALAQRQRADVVRSGVELYAAATSDLRPVASQWPLPDRALLRTVRSLPRPALGCGDACPARRCSRCACCAARLAPPAHGAGAPLHHRRRRDASSPIRAAQRSRCDRTGAAAPTPARGSVAKSVSRRLRAQRCRTWSYEMTTAIDAHDANRLAGDLPLGRHVASSAYA